MATPGVRIGLVLLGATLIGCDSPGPHASDEALESRVAQLALRVGDYVPSSVITVENAELRCTQRGSQGENSMRHVFASAGNARLDVKVGTREGEVVLISATRIDGNDITTFTHLTGTEEVSVLATSGKTIEVARIDNALTRAALVEIAEAVGGLPCEGGP